MEQDNQGRKQRAVNGGIVVMKEIRSESKLTFFEATSIIVGHGVGSGILSVPFLASRNRWYDILWIILLVYGINLVMHFMIAELSYNNGGAQFIKCFEKELFVGRMKKAATWFAFGLLGFSVVVNVSGFIAGASAVFEAWFGLPSAAGMLLFYVLAASVVYIGMKLVGICEKIAVFSMVGVIGILFIATLISDVSPLPASFVSASNLLALYSMVSFSLSAVMSVPQVVKGLNGDRNQIMGSIAAGTGINVGLILLITFMTLLGAGSGVTENGALVDLSLHLGGWVSIIGYIFSLLALATSFWANTLNLRDIVNEQTGWGVKKSWLAASLPCLVIALIGVESFVGFTRLAGVVQGLTGIGIIIAYNRSRKHEGSSLICGRLGTIPFQVIVVVSSLLSTIGSLLAVS
ncbi:aromatic amino acid transport family protein [Eisenbergiella massiliensis]|uniref:aromatic amino acid transport family protein n=1 Tax=Eisenbergiella massiliensis TaxID=1720294 RepID=UPI000C850DD1|nr:aromatic amino acid transport family protein [Eisenbergiella massiliensis]